ncbi:MAG: threonine ammonia-lyase [bacterium]|nr:threonine ammonia-lyase [bacterium]
MVNIQDVRTSYKRIAPFILKTPCLYSPSLSALLKAKIFLKCDHMQYTGSFKERGALNCLMSLTAKQKKIGVVTASAGNHGQAVAFHASRLGIPAHIFMPLNTPYIKVSRTEAFGVKVYLTGENYDDAHRAATNLTEELKAFYLHAYDDEKVIVGQATLGLEIAEQLKNIDKIVVAVGGGGLISGIATVFAAISPSTQIIGVEPIDLPSMTRAIHAKKPVKLAAAYTFADGIRVRRVGQLTFAICARLVHEWAFVDDDQIAKAILFLLEQQKIVAEGAGAAAVAALLEKKIKDVEGKTVCVVIGGGNIDSNVLTQVIERGMVKSGRLVRLKVKIQDQPGKLNELLEIISKTAANVIEIRHERAFIYALWSHVEVDLVLQTKNENHIVEILSLLKAKGYAV